jgi:zinc transport system ATP-binding protein
MKKMVEEVVKLSDVWVQYDGTPVLEDINLSIRRDDFLGLIGPNGGGKTTLLKLMLGLVAPSRGEVSIMGMSPEKGRKHIGYVPQHSLFDRDFPINVIEVVLTGRLSHTKPFHWYSKADREAAVEALRAVEMLDFKKRQIGMLSGGQQQRVFVARALVSEPRLLLLDEPMSSVDTPMQAEFYELLERLKQRMPIVLVSHDISAVSVYVDKIACLNRKLYYHESKELTPEDLEAAYHCPIQMIAHGVPHRVLKEHTHE